MHRFTDTSFNCYCQLLRISINSITMDEHHVFVIKHQLLTEAITHKCRISRRGRSICCVPHQYGNNMYSVLLFLKNRLTMLITQNNQENEIMTHCQFLSVSTHFIQCIQYLQQLCSSYTRIVSFHSVTMVYVMLTLRQMEIDLEERRLFWGLCSQVDH